MQWPNPCALGDLDCTNTCTGDGEVLVGRCNGIHREGCRLGDGWVLREGMDGKNVVGDENQYGAMDCYCVVGFIQEAKWSNDSICT